MYHPQKDEIVRKSYLCLIKFLLSYLNIYILVLTKDLCKNLIQHIRNRREKILYQIVNVFLLVFLAIRFKFLSDLPH